MKHREIEEVEKVDLEPPIPRFVLKLTRGGQLRGRVVVWDTLWNTEGRIRVWSFIYHFKMPILLLDHKQWHLFYSKWRLQRLDENNSNWMKCSSISYRDQLQINSLIKTVNAYKVHQSRNIQQWSTGVHSYYQYLASFKFGT